MKMLTGCVLLLVPLLAVGTAGACDLDQAERERKNLQLQKKYPGSKYNKQNHTLIIPKGKDVISLNIGGCVHHGVAIELKTSKTTQFDDTAKLSEKIYELSKEYSQGIIKHNRVKQIIAGKQWTMINPDIDGYYLLDYDKNANFEFYRRNEQGATYVGLYYYR